MASVSATAARSAVFAMMPTGLAAVATSVSAAEDTFMWLPERASSDRAWSESRCRSRTANGMTTEKRMKPNQQALNVSMLLESAWHCMRTGTQRYGIGFGIRLLRFARQ